MVALTQRRKNMESKKDKAINPLTTVRMKVAAVGLALIASIGVGAKVKSELDRNKYTQEVAEQINNSGIEGIIPLDVASDLLDKKQQESDTLIDGVEVGEDTRVALGSVRIPANVNKRLGPFKPEESDADNNLNINTEYTIINPFIRRGWVGGIVFKDGKPLIFWSNTRAVIEEGGAIDLKPDVSASVVKVANSGVLVDADTSYYKNGHPGPDLQVVGYTSVS